MKMECLTDPPLKDPVKPIRIISDFNGYLTLQKDNLNSILNKLDPEIKDVAILSIIGARKSGKSFLLNLLLKSLEGNPNWIGPLQSKNEALTGFLWHDVASSRFLDQEQGIYMWPVPFSIVNSCDNKVQILLMDTVKVNEDTPGYGPMEEALCLLSTHLVDNHIKNFEPLLLKLLPRLDDLTRTRAKPLSVCRCISFIIRDFETSKEFPWVWGEKAVKYVKTALQGTDFQREYARLQGVETGACLMKAPVHLPVSTEEGILNLDSDFVRQIKTLCSKIFQSLPTFSGGNINQYFSDVVDGLNQLQAMQKHNQFSLTKGTSADTTVSSENKSFENSSDLSTEADNSNVTESDLTDFDADVEMQDLSYEESMNHPIPESDDTNKSQALVKSKVLETSLDEVEGQEMPSNFNTHYESCEEHSNNSAYFPSSPSFSIQVPANDPNHLNPPQNGIERHRNDCKTNQLSSQDLDDKVHKEVKKIREMYAEAMQECNETEFEVKHEVESFKATSQFSNFLNGFPVDNKQENIKQLETHLKQDFQKIKRKRKPIVSSQLNLASVISKTWNHDDTEVQTNPTKELEIGDNYNSKTCTQPQTEQSSDQNSPQNTSLEINNAQTTLLFGSETLASLMKEYDELMIRHLQTVLVVSEDELSKFHIISRKKILEKLSLISKQEQLPFDKVQKEVDDCLSTQLNLLWNEMFSRNRFIRQQITSSIADFEHRIKTAMGPWIIQFTNLNTRFKPDYALLYRSTLMQVISTGWFSNKSPQQRKLFQESVESGTEWILKFFKELQDALTTYEKQMNKSFDLYRCFNPEKFEEVHQKAIDCCQKPQSGDGAFLNKELQLGIYYYKQQFQARNNYISENEKQLAQSLLPSLHNFYNDEMKNAVKENIFTKDDLETLHKIVADHCLEAFKKACDFRSESGMPKFKIELKNGLDEQLQTYKQSNRLKGAKVFNTITKAIENHKKMYNEKMDNILPKKGKSMDRSELEKHHETIHHEVSHLLKMEMRKIDVSIVSSIDKHVNELKAKILVDWDCIKNSNEEKMEKEKLKQNEFEREESKREAAEKLEQQENEVKKRKSTNQKSVETNTSRYSEPPKDQNTFKSQDYRNIAHKNKPSIPCEPLEPISLPPIAIEFGLHKIRVGWIHDGRFELIQNPWCEEETPNLIALTLENEVLIGQEVERRPNNQLRFHFKLEEVLNNPKDNETLYSCNMDGNRKTRKEFLCGLVLSRIKSDTEKQLGGTWTTAIITVPLWYTSVQRQATRDAATIAGFSKVCLINETSAAALSLANSDCRSNNPNENSVLVAACSDFHFDAAIYGYATGKVTMISSCGDLHSSVTPQISIKKRLKDMATGVKNFIWTSEEEKSPFRSIIKDIVGANKDDIKESVLIDVGSPKDGTKYLQSFKNIIEQYGRPYKNQPEKLIIKGAAIFASSTQNPTEDKLKDISRELIKDKATYTFQRKIGRATNDFFEYQALCPTEVKVEHTISLKGNNAGVELDVLEMSAGNEFRVGRITVKVDNHVPDVQIRFSLNNESIMGAEAFLNEKKRNKQQIPLIFSTPCIDEKQMSLYTLLVKSLQKDEEKEAFEKSKKELEDLVKEIQAKIESVKSVIGKKLLENKILEAVAFLEHAHSTQEMLHDSIELLTKLRSKYIKDN